MITSKLSSKGQITVPKQIREFLHADCSDTILFVPQDNGKVTITVAQKSASSLFGMLRHRKQEKPASVKQMNKAIAKRRQQRGLK